MSQIRPQNGPQVAFLSSPADIAIFGGAAGGGKTWTLLVDPLRHKHNPRFVGLIFRRTYIQIKNPGGLWDASTELYTQVGGFPKETPPGIGWTFPEGSRVLMGYMQGDADRLNFQGAEIPFIGFDELTHFSKTQFFYMLSRNRSTSGVRGYIRATCNPDPDSWVAEFIAWWIDPETGYPIPERAGKLRWFIRDGDDIHWADSPEELAKRFPTDTFPPKSVTFIPASLHDNQILMQKDPGYLANLMAMGRVEREQLLKGNWKIRPAAGNYFRREWFEVIRVPPRPAKIVRYWDLAATEQKDSNDPDWTVGFKMSRSDDGVFCIEEIDRFRETPLKVEQRIRNTASRDGVGVTQIFEQDPGQAGKDQAQRYVRLLAGYNVRLVTVHKDKVTRASPFSAQCEANNVKVIEGPWNEAWFSEGESFPSKGIHDDQIDGGSGAFTFLTKPRQTPMIASIG